MPRFTVYHTQKAFYVKGRYELLPLSCYEVVATVEASCVDEAWQLTQNGIPGRPDMWPSNPEVIEVLGRGLRSTDVGDLIEEETGGFWRVEGMGFSAVRPRL